LTELEVFQVLTEIRDQLKRLADLLEGATNGSHNLNVELGDVRVKIVEPPKKKVLLDL